jgi:hypothetical protein
MLMRRFAAHRQAHADHYEEFYQRRRRRRRDSPSGLPWSVVSA